MFTYKRCFDVYKHCLLKTRRLVPVQEVTEDGQSVRHNGPICSTRLLYPPVEGHDNMTLPFLAAYKVDTLHARVITFEEKVPPVNLSVLGEELFKDGIVESL